MTRSPNESDAWRTADVERDLDVPPIVAEHYGRPCDKCGDEIVGARYAFVRVIYPTRIVKFHVCRSCADAVVATMTAAAAQKDAAA